MLPNIETNISRAPHRAVAINLHLFGQRPIAVPERHSDVLACERCHRPCMRALARALRAANDEMLSTSLSESNHEGYRA